MQIEMLIAAYIVSEGRFFPLFLLFIVPCDRE